MPRNATKKAAERQAKSDEMKKLRPNVEKMCSFWELPTLLRAPILTKVDAVSMAHLRSANKELNLLVEKTDLRARSDHKLVIKVELDLEKYQLSFLTTQGKFCDKSGLDLLPITFYRNCNLTKIGNPRKQLVGVHFNFIVVEFVRPNQESAQGFWKYFERRALPILDELRLQCKILVFQNTDVCDVSPAVTLITFNSLKFVDCTVDSTKMKWTIENGEVLIIREIKPDITPAFEAIVQFKEVVLSVFLHDNGVKEVIKAIRELPLGKLERLQLLDLYTLFESDEESDEEKSNLRNLDDLRNPRNVAVLPLVQTIRSMDSKEYPDEVKFFKMPISQGGYAIITQDWADEEHEIINFKFYIYREYSRKNLFDAFVRSYFLELDAVSNSPQYREFFEAETDEIAINVACEYGIDLWENMNSTDTSNVSEQ